MGGSKKRSFEYREILVLFLCWVFWGIAQGVAWSDSAPRISVVMIVQVRGIQAFFAFLFNLLFVAYVNQVKLLKSGTFFYYLSMFSGLLLVVYLLVFVNSSLFFCLMGRDIYFMGMAKYTTLALAKCIFVGGFSTLFFLLKYDKRYKTQQQKIAEAQHLVREAKLMMLQYQLNPHFLFNSLNSIRALVFENQEKAREMVTEFSEFIRSVLLYNENTTTLVQSEIQIVKNYLRIQQIRFSDDMVFSFDVDASVLNIEVPCFILQPLVENSIKYGMMTSEMPLEVRVTIRKKVNRLVIAVKNSGSLVENGSPEGNNTGISNIVKRLELYYGDKVYFKLREHSGIVTAGIYIDGFY